MPENAIPGVSVGIVQVLVLTSRPLVEQDCSGIFPAKKGAQGSFEGAPEEHGRPGIFFSPAIEISMPIAARAGEVLADLGGAVGHQATCSFSRFAGESSCQRPAGANPSSRSRSATLKMMWLILTTPFSPTSCPASS